MNLVPLMTMANLIAGLIALIPFLAAAFFPQRLAGRTHSLPIGVQLGCPALLSLPYVVVAFAAGSFRWEWFVLYAVLPVAVALLLDRAARIDKGKNGTWIDFLVLAVLGLSVDLRWFEVAWPPHLAIFNKVILLDAGIYGFILVRNLGGTGFDLRLRLPDVVIGMREVAMYTPVALALGLGLGFLHAHAVWPPLTSIAFAWIFSFFFIAVPEELFFRGWLQNLLERRMGRTPALFFTAALFGLAHFNKRTVHFNWRYVLLAALAGIFYGRAWRQQRRVGASAVAHASVDAIWSLWLK